MPDSWIRPRRGFAAGGDGGVGEGACSIQGSRATLGRSTIYLIIIILFISFTHSNTQGALPPLPRECQPGVSDTLLSSS